MAEAVVIDVRGFRRMAATVKRDMSPTGSGHIRAAFRQWAARYRGAMQERYDRFSRGGGDWPPLSPRTIAGRRGPRRGFTGARQISVLRDTGTLFNALDPQFNEGKGGIEQMVRNGITVGFGGPARHPRGSATIVDIANFHQQGAGRLPRREILVQPDSRLQSAMASDMQQAIDRALREASL